MVSVRSTVAVCLPTLRHGPRDRRWVTSTRAGCSWRPMQRPAPPHNDGRAGPRPCATMACTRPSHPARCRAPQTAETSLAHADTAGVDAAAGWSPRGRPLSSLRCDQTSAPHRQPGSPVYIVSTSRGWFRRSSRPRSWTPTRTHIATMQCSLHTTAHSTHPRELLLQVIQILEQLGLALAAQLRSLDLRHPDYQLRLCR